MNVLDGVLAVSLPGLSVGPLAGPVRSVSLGCGRSNAGLSISSCFICSGGSADRAMTLAHALYPYALAAVNVAVGWLSYTRLAPDFGILFLTIGLLVFLAGVGRTARRYRSVRTWAGPECDRS